MNPLSRLTAYPRVGNLESLAWFAPELCILAGMLAVIFWDLTTKREHSKGGAYLSLLFLAAALVATVTRWSAGFGSGPGLLLFTGSFAADPLAFFFKVVFILATVYTVLISLGYPDFQRRRMGEYYALLLGVVLGLFLMAGATHLLMFYLALEMVSYLSYVLVGYVKEDRRASEAALKYVLFGSVSSGAMIFGISLLYGLTGTLDLARLGTALSTLAGAPPALFLAILLILAGIGYKIAAVPFHFWCPDVYEGANTPITAFLSVGPKAAGFALLARLVYGGVSNLSVSGAAGLDWGGLAALLSVLTMTLGNLVAVQQNSVKRMLAYSSIAHAGYMLMVFAVPGERSLAAVALYLLVYLFMNLGAFLVVMALRGRVEDEEALRSFRGLGQRYPMLAVWMGVFLISLTGLPPTAGFIGKLYLFATLIDARLYWLAVVGALNSVLALYYYARVLKVMFLERVEAQPVLQAVGAQVRADRISGYYMVLVWALGIPTLFFGLFWSPLADLVQAGLAGMF